MDCSDDNVDDPMEVSSSSGAKPNSATTKKITKKTFQLKWLELSEFKGWLSSVPGDPYSAKCSCCGVVLSAGKSDLTKHSKSPKHLLNVRSIKNIAPANKAMEKCSERQQHERDVKEMEIQLSGFFC